MKTGSKENHTDTNTYLSHDMNGNISKIKSELGNSSDLAINISAELNENIIYASLYIENMVDKNSINSLSSEIIELSQREDLLKGLTPSEYFDTVSRCVSSFRKYQEGNTVTWAACIRIKQSWV